MACPQCNALGIPIRDEAAAHEPGTQDLVVPEGETIVLDPHVQKYASLFAQVSPKTLSEMKKLIGLPDGMHATVDNQRFQLSSTPPRNIGEDGREAGGSKTFMRAIVEEFIYRDSVHTQAFARLADDVLSDINLHVVSLGNIVVKRFSTLVINRSVDRLNARDVTVEAGGKLAIRGRNLIMSIRSLRDHGSIFVIGTTETATFSQSG